MVTELISHTIAEWACSVRRHDWQTETKLRHDAERARRDMEPKRLARRGVEPGSSPRQGQEAEVGTGGFTARRRRKQLRDHCTVESLGQLALSRHWDTQVVRRQYSLVVGSDGSKGRGMRGS